MARRTTPERVRQANPSIPEASNLDLAIDSATSLVDQLSECASKEGNTLDNQRLELIETWLAAHFSYIGNPTHVSSKSVGGASQSFLQGPVSTGLDASPFGTQALKLDSSGCLERITGESVKIFWVGGQEDKYNVDWN